MSQDLFAAFVTSTQPNDEQGKPASQIASNSFFKDLKSDTLNVAGPVHPQPVPLVPNLLEVDDDDWGDFEAADSGTQALQNAPVIVPQSLHHYSLDDLGPVKKISQSTESSVQEPNPFVVFEMESPDNTHNQFERDGGFSSSSGVLFDATEDFDEEDDFGDFEDPVNQNLDVVTSIVQKTAEIDLLGLDDEVTVQPPHQGNRVVADVKPQPGIAFGSTIPASTKSTEKSQTTIKTKLTHHEPANTAAKPKAIASKQTSVKPRAIEEQETWDDMSAWDEEAVHEQATMSNPTNLAPLIANDVTEDAIPPTNIPPPALLLSIFPSIFQRVERELLRPAAAQTHAVRQQMYSDSQTVEYLRGYMAVLTVFARIIAGRKLRWKRDTILAQSMRIGSASAGRVSGMKVTSIDKTELKKEDGEAAEALDAWASQAGRVRTAVNEARKTHPDLGIVPDLKEIMLVKTLKEIDGGLASLKPCTLCGLKREERIPRVDINVMDSFGEWWIERTSMHRGMFNRCYQYVTD